MTVNVKRIGLVVATFLALGATACTRTVQVATPPPAPPRPAPTPAPTPRPPARITTAEGVVRAMHDRYDGKWYRTVAFRQKTTFTSSAGNEVVQTWNEAASLPGKLRIDFDDPSKGSGVLFVRDSTFTFAQGKLTKADTGVNELLVLGFDVYTQPATTTLAALRRMKIDLSRMHERMWHDKWVYVVGAHLGDTTSKQFWVDRENLLFVRLIEPTRQGLNDIRFEQYIPAGNGWIAMRVEQFVNGVRRVREEYSNLRIEPPLPDALFDPRRWSEKGRE